jgi:hypothetical protein
MPEPWVLRHRKRLKSPFLNPHSYHSERAYRSLDAARASSFIGAKAQIATGAIRRPG